MTSCGTDAGPAVDPEPVVAGAGALALRKAVVCVVCITQNGLDATVVAEPAIK